MDFLNIPLLKQYIQIEKTTETLWKSSITEGKSSELTQGISECPGTVLTEHSPTPGAPPAAHHTVLPFTETKVQNGSASEVTSPKSSNFIQTKAEESSK